MPALSKEMVPALVATGATARMPDPVPPRFRVGDAVIARNVHPVGHSRIPRYLKGRRGVVHRDHGVFAFPDAAAGGQGHIPQHVYSVRFMARELWGEQASPLDSIHIDLFDEYMDPDPAAAATPAAAERAQVRPRRSTRPQRSAHSKPRKARRPGVRLKKAEKPKAGARKARKAAKKRAAPAKARKVAAKPARGARKATKKAGRRTARA